MSNTTKELDKKKKVLKRIYKINIPLGIIVGVIYSLVYPRMPRKGGRPPMIEEMKYSEAIIETFILFFIIFSFSMYFIILKKKKKIEELERDIYVENKKTKQYTSTSNFRN